MGLTNFPNGIFATPNIGAALGYGWKTDSIPYFVDGTQGNDGNTGKSPESAFVTIQKAIDTADKHDVIYIFDKDLGTSGTGVTGKYTENLTITKAKHNLALIGLGQLIGKPVRECGLYNSGASPVLTIQAGSATCENLKFSFATSATYGVYAISGEDTTSYAHNAVFYNCRFAGFTAGSALRSIGVQGLQVYKCQFVDNLVSIHAVSGTATATDIIIDSNLFGCNAIATTLISADIRINTQGSSYVAITDNIFAHLLPAGALGRWIHIADTRQGIIAGNQFGGVQATAYTIGSSGTGCVCPNNVGIGQNYSNGALMARA